MVKRKRAIKDNVTHSINKGKNQSLSKDELEKRIDELNEKKIRNSKNIFKH